MVAPGSGMMGKPVGDRRSRHGGQKASLAPPRAPTPSQVVPAASRCSA
jgi:hypothetical protein